MSENALFFPISKLGRASLDFNMVYIITFDGVGESGVKISKSFDSLLNPKVLKYFSEPQSMRNKILRIL